MLIKSSDFVFSLILIFCSIAHQDGMAQRCSVADSVGNGKIISTITPFEKRSAYRFQVVFHVMFTNDDENISMIQILSQLEILNKIYDENVSSEDPNIPQEFRKLKASPNIHFCLADKDPNGKITNGVTRTKINDINIACKKFAGNKRYIMHTSLGGLDIWPPDQYINIYAINREQCNALGESVFPWDATMEDDGIIIDYRAIGFIGTAANNKPFHQGKTLVHEMGHYFGLKHLSGDHHNDCLGDDFVSDTPIQSDDYSGCPFNPQSSCGNKAMYMNYMCTVDDPCMLLFTKGQVDRMHSIIQQYRYELANHSCIDVPETSIDELFLIYNQGFYQIKNQDNKPWSGNCELIDTRGRLIWASASKQSISLSIPVFNINLHPGMYFLRISQNNSHKTFKFINFP